MLYKLRRLTKIYGSRTILDIPKLDIEPGKIYTLIGPNGAGKSTLLNVLAFLDSPSSGSVHFHSTQVGAEAKALMQLRRKVVLVDQYPILFTGPVWKNLDFGLKIRKIPKRQRLAKVEEALELVGMQEFYHADAHNLSGGETKRIALARALVLNPEVLLCDEPTANVDTEHQEVIMNILERSNREAHLSVIFATHYLSQAQRLAHHTLVLQNGRLSAQSRENIYNGALVSQDEQVAVYLLGSDVQLRVAVEKFQNDIFEKQQFFLDPDLLRIGNGKRDGEEDDNRYIGIVTKIEKENGRIRITVEAGIKVQLLLLPETYRANPPWIGEEVTLVIPHEAIQPGNGATVLPKSSA